MAKKPKYTTSPQFWSDKGQDNKLSGSFKDSKRLFNADKVRRDAAKGILTPEAIGNLDTAQLLETTLGGVKREITRDDLQEFQRSIKAFERNNADKKIIGGIRPSQVIHMSRDIDIQRANKQITRATLLGGSSGNLRFQTNASGETANVFYHYVNVQLLDLESIISKPRKNTSAKEAANGRVKFECDCGRHTFWYRYIATIGGWNLGRAETGFPKIRNPQLTGVGCKHVLRVMRELMTSVYIHQRIEKLLDSTAKRKKISVTQQQAERIAKRQRYAPKQVSKTKAERAALRQLRAMVAEDAQTVETNKNRAKLNLQNMLAQGMIDQKQYQAMLKITERDHAA